MKKMIIFIALLITQSSLYSQKSSDWTNDAGADMRNVRFKNGVFNNNMEYFAMAKVTSKNNTDYYKNAAGQYYFDKEWGKCKVLTKENKTYLLDLCNYNIFDKRFEFIVEKEVYFLKENPILSVFFKNKMFIPFKGIDDKSNYYRLIHKFNNNLELVETYTLKKKSIPSSFSLGLYTNKAEIKPKKFLLKNKELIELPKSKKEILILLNKSYKKEVHKKLNLKKESDLVELINS